MSTRLYLRASEAADISPAPQAGFVDTAGYATRMMRPTKLAGDSVADVSKGWANSSSALIRMYVSPPMVAGLVINGTTTLHSMWARCFEGVANDNVRVDGHIWICSNDGATNRYTVGSYNNSGNEPQAGIREAHAWANATTAGGGAGYTTVAGDRYVLEMGAYDVAGTSPAITVEVGSDAALADLPASEYDQTAGLGWFQTDLNLSFSDAPPIFSAVKPQPAEASVTIDGRAVDMTEFRCDSVADWGDRSLTGRLKRDVTWAEQGAPIVVWRRSDDALWAGELTADPRIDGGAQWIRAAGNATKIAADRTRMLYRVDGGAGFSSAEEDPYGYPNNEKFDMESRRGALIWRLGDGTTAYGVNNQSGMVIWLEGGLITRYSFTVDSSSSFANMEIQTHEAPGPSGTRVLEGTHALNPGGGFPVDYARTLTTPNDLLSIRMNVTGAFTPAQKHRVKLNNIKVYGRTIDDAFSISDVVTDVAGLAGLATTNVQAYGTSALPLDWPDDHTDLLDYMAELADWRWLARFDGVHFGPYETVWEASTARETTGDLEPEPRYNRVVQPYRALSGALRTATATATVDPFPGEVVAAPAEEELEDPQPDSSLATAVAQARVDFLSSRRVTANLRLVRVKHDGWPRSPLEVNPGDLLTLTDLAPDLVPQRIAAVTYERSVGDVEPRVTVEIGNGFNMVRALTDAERGRPRRRRKRRKAA